MRDWSLSVSDASSSVYFGSGWTDASESAGPISHRWSVDTTATIRVPVVQGQGRIFLEVAGMPYLVPAQVEYQDVWVFVEGAMTAFARLNRAGNITGVIPGFAVENANSTIDLSFVLPGAVVPADLGVSDDRRKLAFALQSLKLTW